MRPDQPIVDVADPAAVLREAERRNNLLRQGQRIFGQGTPTQARVAAATHAFIAHGEMRITLPWSTLITDGNKFGVINGRMINTKEFRAAKKRATELAREQLAGRAPLEGPVRFVATLYEPDRRTRRDIVNLGKLVQDSLTKVAYLDDSQIDDARWIRGPVDVDRPRLEITITPLP